MAKTFSGPSLFFCDEIAESFTKYIIFDMLDDARCRQFADDLVENFVAKDSDFPPTMWADALKWPDLMPAATN